ncbi:hypothetical protein GCM10009801_40050 [Streptomyces albiaxialis]|uniref:Uncharacterized protein n=1 Tax=Streptomyces albiaxialis TaxID=329523 RepID=A0ABN2W2H5_9ACTN
MTAPAQTTTATAATPDRSGTAVPGGVQTRLPWWAVALPAVAFVALLALLVGGGEANAAEQPGGSLFVAVLEQLRDALPG